MPDNTEFFESGILGHEIPCVFISRKPAGIPADFVGFDNYSTVYRLTEQLLRRNYRRIALITGSSSYSSESDSIRGYQKAFQEYGIPMDASLLLETNMSREDSFQAVLDRLKPEAPEAIITTSENIAHGVLEALHVQNISMPDRIVLLTLGEESWNQTARIPGMIYTSRSAYSLGADCGRAASVQNSAAGSGTQKRTAGRPGGYRPPVPAPSSPQKLLFLR